MYNPRHFRSTDRDAIAELVRQHPLGLIISTGADGIVANPLPFLYFPQEGEHGVLRAHQARANPQWQGFAQNSTCLIVFQGEEGYISPSWYASKASTHQVVPTWNYAMVQMHGNVRTTEDPAWLHSQITALTAMQEQRMPQPWQVTDAPADFIERQKRAIVGLEITVTRLDAKWKMSQNRSAADQAGVVQGLREAPAREGAEALARAMERSGRGSCPV